MQCSKSANFQYTSEEAYFLFKVHIQNSVSFIHHLRSKNKDSTLRHNKW